MEVTINPKDLIEFRWLMEQSISCRGRDARRTIRAGLLRISRRYPRGQQLIAYQLMAFGRVHYTWPNE